MPGQRRRVVFKPKNGLNEEIIREMSAMKKEPEWLLEFRLKTYTRNLNKPIQTSGRGGALEDIDFDDTCYYVKRTRVNRRTGT